MDGVVRHSDLASCSREGKRQVFPACSRHRRIMCSSATRQRGWRPGIEIGARRIGLAWLGDNPRIREIWRGCCRDPIRPRECASSGRPRKRSTGGRCGGARDPEGKTLCMRAGLARTDQREKGAWAGGWGPVEAMAKTGVSSWVLPLDDGFKNDIGQWGVLPALKTAMFSGGGAPP